MGCGGSSAVANAVTGGKARVVFVIGGPGSGKGTQCTKIKDEFNYNHMSTGDILRNVVKEKQGSAWQELEADMKEGKLIPSDKLISFVKLGIVSSKNKKILLDGFPRNQDNINEWNKQMKNVADVVAVVYFEVPDDVMKQRLLGRNEGRADDNEETIAKRLETFNAETKPVIDTYEKEGKLIKIDATKSVDEVFTDVKNKFMEKKLYQ
jgi:UMP-CMP kinase family protein